jgi:hypothetical protein
MKKPVCQSQQQALKLRQLASLSQMRGAKDEAV